MVDGDWDPFISRSTRWMNGKYLKSIWSGIEPNDTEYGAIFY